MQASRFLNDYTNINRSNDADVERALVMKFYKWSDKIKFLRDHETRGAMASDGFPLAADLTKQQTLKLGNLWQKGKTGYFRNSN